MIDFDFGKFAGHFAGHFVDQVGWFLLHSLWQIAGIALLFILGRSIIGSIWRSNTSQQAKLIYWLGCCSMLLMLVAPLATVLMNLATQPQITSHQSTMFPELVDPFVVGSSASRFLELPNPEVIPAEVEAVRSMNTAAASGMSRLVSGQFNSILAASGIRWEVLRPWCVGVWLIGVLLFLLRPVLGLREIARLKNTGVHKPTAEFVRMARRIAAELEVPKFELSISKLARAPMVAGYLRPVVLLPVSMISELSVQQVELIIRHELAHVRRHDVLVNLIQVGVESVFFFHPCMWFVSRAVRQERENCCDDVATEHGSTREYADALIAIEQSRQPALAMASSGGKLLSRIERMFVPNRGAGRVRWFEGLLPVVLLAGFLVVAGLQTSLMANPQDDVVEHRLVKRNFSKTKLGKALELELKKLDQMGFSGSVLVSKEGQIILVTSEGTSDKQQKTEIQPTSLFEIASITKSFTSTAALILAEQGKLDLGASIDEYLPGVPVSSRSITVRHLMQHRSGIPADSYGDTQQGLKVAVETMLGDGPQNKPGTRFEYWNQGYILLSEIIAKAADKPYVDVVRELIFEPANMEGSCFNGDPLPRGFSETVGTGSIGAPRTCLEHPYGSYGLMYRGTGGLVSNVFDMWKFHHALQQGRLLSADSIEQSFDRGSDDLASPYGMGWFVRDSPGRERCVSHGGKVRGFSCDFRRYPESDSCIVVLGNSDDCPSTTVGEIIEGILFPPAQEEQLAASEVEAFVGSYQSKEGRQIHIEEQGGRAVYTVLWQPGNPAGPVSRGYVQRDEKGGLVFYQSNETTKVKAIFLKDKTKVRSIRYGKGKYVRADDMKRDGAGAAKLPEKLPDAEARKFVGVYETGFGQKLTVEREEGFLIFAMTWSGRGKENKTVGYLRKRTDGQHVLYHPSAPMPIEFKTSVDGEVVQSITAKKLNMLFKRTE